MGEESETNGEDRTGDGQLIDGLPQKVALGQSEVREVVRERPLRLTEAQENLMGMSRLERLQTQDIAGGEGGESQERRRDEAGVVRTPRESGAGVECGLHRTDEKPAQGARQGHLPSHGAIARIGQESGRSCGPRLRWPLPDQGQSSGQIDGGENRGEAEAQAGQDAIGSDRGRSIE